MRSLQKSRLWNPIFIILVFLSLSGVSCSILIHNLSGGDDALIIDGLINVSVRPRGIRQYFEVPGPIPLWTLHTVPVPSPIMEYQDQPFTFMKSEITISDSLEMECITNTDGVGKCMQLEKCYPLRNTEEFPADENLNQEIRGSLQNKNCSSVIHAGASKYGNICCPLPERIIPQEIKETESKETTMLPPTVNSLIDNESGAVFRSQVCGQRSVPELKIVNGTATIPGELPWMVAIFGKSGRVTCGGSLLSENIVITAAHCINKYTAHDISKLKIYIGDYNIQTTSDGHHEVRGVKRIIKHKHFNEASFVNDIALLRLDKPVTFSNRIQPICLPSGSRNLANQKLLVAGWGRKSLNGPTSPILLKVGVRVWKNSDCERTYRGIAPAGILSTMICAGEKGLDSCVGDSGGPLMLKSDSGYQQIGIVSFGKGCATYPGVYTRVTEYLPWISVNMNK